MGIIEGGGLMLIITGNEETFLIGPILAYVSWLSQNFRVSHELSVLGSEHDRLNPA